jgi:hypothetical protein
LLSGRRGEFWPLQLIAICWRRIPQRRERARIASQQRTMRCPRFLSKSAQFLGNKRVVIFKSAKKCKKVQQSAQDLENTGNPSAEFPDKNGVGAR